MSLADGFDVVLCLTVIAVAAGAVLGRELFGGVALYVVYGLLLAVAWVRLGAVDVALAEAAIGAGLTGVLLMGAAARVQEAAPLDRSRLPIVPPLLCAALAGVLGWAALAIIGPDPGLRPLVEAHLPGSGASNPVTAVLINFRGWDTLLESMVLLVALIGVWALAADRHWGGRPGIRQRARPEGVLATFGRFLPPLGIVIGAYLVWIGSSAPGGAFQAGTVLAAVFLLATMAGVIEPPPVSSARLRSALVLGPALFLIVGFRGLAYGAFLAFPPAEAKVLVLLVESGLALSVAATLALLVLGPPARIR